VEQLDKAKGDAIKLLSEADLKQRPKDRPLLIVCDETLQSSYRTSLEDSNTTYVDPGPNGLHVNDGNFMKKLKVKYDEIKRIEADFKFPMMGSGCSSTVFNTTRDNVIKQLKRKENKNES